jgi:hypothetical protein
MKQLKIYDSGGSELTGDRAGQTNKRIEDFFFAGVRLAVDVESTPELICFFRARENNSGRSEQFYAQYTCESKQRLFSNFRSDLERRVEQKGLTLETDIDDVAVYRQLARINPEKPGLEVAHRAIQQILGSGTQTRVGVPDYQTAYSMGNQYIREGATDNYVIAEDTSHSSLSRYDLLMEPEHDPGFEPIGKTKRDFEQVYLSSTREARRELEGEFPWLRSVGAEQNEAQSETIFGIARPALAAGCALLTLLFVLAVGILTTGALGCSQPIVGDVCQGPLASDSPGSESVTVDYNGSVKGLSGNLSGVQLRYANNRTNSTVVPFNISNIDMEDIDVSIGGREIELEAVNATPTKAEFEFENETSVEDGSAEVQLSISSKTTSDTRSVLVAFVDAKNTTVGSDELRRIGD